MTTTDDEQVAEQAAEQEFDRRAWNLPAPRTDAGTREHEWAPSPFGPSRNDRQREAREAEADS